MSEIRTFETGATRDSVEGKLDFEGFLSPFALERYAQYMHRHRVQPDGSLRDSDNWQKGIPQAEYMKSLWRHFFAAWKIWRGGRVVDERDGHDVSLEETMCAILFNAMGFLHVQTAPKAKPTGLSRLWWYEPDGLPRKIHSNTVMGSAAPGTIADTVSLDEKDSS
jgi:hypothetical protein